MGSALASLDWSEIGANAGVFFLAVTATVGGIYKALKESKKQPTVGDGDRVASAIIMETTSMVMLSESLRQLSETNRDLNREVIELRQEVRKMVDRARGRR